ncbi:MAG: hypothetical protein H5U03_05765 [Clostridia bacterium]|nr:hypothetical protein [Clostridia bacterium]
MVKVSPERADNARRSFKCDVCGTMFSVPGEAGLCPKCGNRCDENACPVVDASDEDY